MDFAVQLAKCMVDNDARMPRCPSPFPRHIPSATRALRTRLFGQRLVFVPRFKVSGELPLLHVRISDQKIQSVVGLVQSVPLPSMDSAPSTPTEKVRWLPLGGVGAA